MVDRSHPGLSVVRQCALLSISRSHYYGPIRGESAENLALMRLIDAQFLETPWYGSRQMTHHLRRQGHVVNRKRVRRLMGRMGLAAIYQRPKTSVPWPTPDKNWPSGDMTTITSHPTHRSPTKPRQKRAGRLSYLMAPRPARLPNPKPTTINPKDSRYERGTTGGGRSKTGFGLAMA
jgi:hypothetical protein